MDDDIDDDFSRSNDAEIGMVGISNAVNVDKLDTTNHLIDLYSIKSWTKIVQRIADPIHLLIHSLIFINLKISACQF